MTEARLLPLIQGSSEVLLSLVPDQNTSVAAQRASPPHIRAPGTQAQNRARPARRKSDKKNAGGKTYGARSATR